MVHSLLETTSCSGQDYPELVKKETKKNKNTVKVKKLQRKPAKGATMASLLVRFTSFFLESCT